MGTQEEREVLGAGLREAIEAIKAGRLDEARRAVGELSSNLNVDYGGEMAFSTLRVYVFCNRVIVDAMKGTPKPGDLAYALGLLERELDRHLFRIRQLIELD
jgi:hypothetical protein